jgi:cyclopropane fatty-acyl-phospholipid synthase-like methyltransferase
MSMEFYPDVFDAAVAFYVIFHLAREEQPELFRRVYTWLKPGGYLLATVSLSDEAPYTEEDFFGVRMFWANFAAEGYERMLTRIGFSIVEQRAVSHGYEESYDGPAERHPLILARKPYGGS